MVIKYSAKLNSCKKKIEKEKGKREMEMERERDCVYNNKKSENTRMRSSQPAVISSQATH